MDLLSQRYASPFFVLDEIIQNCEFGEWVNFFIKKTDDEKDEKTLWEFYLFRVFDKSFTEFKNEIKNPKTMNEATKEEIMKKSQNILDGFIPERKG